MGLVVRLLGKPAIERDGEAVKGPRGRKAWGLLAYLALTDLRPNRGRLAELLFADADDPLGALRWSLAELRRALGTPDALTGEQPRLELPAGSRLDAWELAGAAAPAPADIDPNEVGGELLEGMDFSSSPAFESWLLVERHHLAAASEALLHEVAMSRLGTGDPATAARIAARLVALNPLVEENQELLVRSLARSGDPEGALAQVKTCEELFLRELGKDPSPAVRRAARPPGAAPSSDRFAARALLETGQAQVAGGAIDAGIDELRQASELSRAADDPALQVQALNALGTALVHAARGRDEEGAVALHEALAIAERTGLREAACKSFLELGYVDVQAGRPERADAWLARAEEIAEGDAELANVLSVRGMLLSDLADYPGALERLRESVERAESAGHHPRAAFSLSLVARAHLLRDELEAARAAVDRSLEIVASESWVSFRPWPETLRGEIDFREGRVDEAAERLEQAFALGCHVGDPCWEGAAARMLGIVEADRGRADLGLEWLEQARTRAARVPDSYAWVQAYVLDALAGLAIDQELASAPAVVDSQEELAARSNMKEFVVRALVHRSRLDRPASVISARELAAEIENPALDRLLEAA
jgi:DNA-binding SARP family transcriptional activator